MIRFACGYWFWFVCLNRFYGLLLDWWFECVGVWLYLLFILCVCLGGFGLGLGRRGFGFSLCGLVRLIFWFVLFWVGWVWLGWLFGCLFGSFCCGWCFLGTWFFVFYY